MAPEPLLLTIRRQQAERRTALDGPIRVSFVAWLIARITGWRPRG